MPSVDVAMARSLKGGVLGSLAAGLQANFHRRDAVTSGLGSINDAETAFSSWGNCMQASICKWPVIAIIIVGSLILFSILWCIVRCCCCGLSCCCECCYCLKCCGECCGMCDTPKGTRHKHLDDSYMPPTQGYKSQAPMQFPAVARMPPSSAPPQYAEFDMSKKGEDALPAMPSWDSAGSKKVMLEEEGVEMDHLKKPEAAQTLPLMSGGTSSAASPTGEPRTSPYGQPGHGNGSGYLAANGGNLNGGGYGPLPPSHGVDQYGGSYGGGYGQHQTDLGYGPALAPQAPANDGYGMGPGQRSPPRGASSPMPGYAGGYGDVRRSPRPQMDYGADVRRSPRPQYDYGADVRRSPMPQNDYGADVRRSPRPQNDYGYDQNQQYPPNGGYNRPYPAAPQRQYSSDSTRPLASRPSPERQYSAGTSPSPIQNNSGFDFNSGFSRPQTANFSRRPSGSPQGSPQRSPQRNGGPQAAYPGYRAYQPQPQGWGGA